MKQDNINIIIVLLQLTHLGAALYLSIKWLYFAVNLGWASPHSIGIIWCVNIAMIGHLYLHDTLDKFSTCCD